MLPLYEIIKRTQTEIRSHMAPSRRTSTANYGGQRGLSTWPWRRIESQSRLWFVSSYNHKGNARTPRAATDAGTNSASRRRATIAFAARSRFASNPGRVGGTVSARGSGISFALDDQEHSFACGRTLRPAPCGQPRESRPTVASDGLQPSRQSEDRRERRSP